MISTRYNHSFKYHGNESDYPFQLSNIHFECLNAGMEASRILIPTGGFQGSFKPVNPLNVKGLYRSVDWIDWFLYVVPTLVVALFDDLTIRNAILALVRGCSLALQWEVSKENLEEIKLYVLLV